MYLILKIQVRILEVILLEANSGSHMFLKKLVDAKYFIVDYIDSQERKKDFGKGDR